LYNFLGFRAKANAQMLKIHKYPTIDDDIGRIL